MEPILVSFTFPFGSYYTVLVSSRTSPGMILYPALTAGSQSRAFISPSHMRLPSPPTPSAVFWKAPS